MSVIALEEVLYKRYETLLLKRDAYEKEVDEIYMEYLRTFGDELIKIYEKTISCIALKKKIQYCQTLMNRNQKIERSSLETYIENVMNEYNIQLRNLIHDHEASKQGQTISDAEIRKIKEIYRRIAKRIHPDKNPDAFKRFEVQNLWNRIVIAYKCNQLKELEELEVLINRVLIGDTIVFDDLNERIENLEKEIDRIVQNNPYQYKYLLMSKDDIQSYLEELKERYQDQMNYEKKLQEIFDSFQIEECIN